jgi:7-cyano-7-deazaguanine reductase
VTQREKLSDTSGLTQLGGGASKPSRTIETFPFRHAANNTIVTFKCTEFTCFCPLTGQPDYATIDISYQPADRAIESKSLRNYLWSYRDSGVFHEDVANLILNDLFTQCTPTWMEVTVHFNVRGGIAIDVAASRGQRVA